MMKRTAGCLLLAGALSLSACSTINPYTGEKQTSKAAGGAAIGAVSGALIGIATSDSAKERKERALHPAPECQHPVNFLVGDQDGMRPAAEPQWKLVRTRAKWQDFVKRWQRTVLLRTE
jgi:hypothetical protein